MRGNGQYPPEMWTHAPPASGGNGRDLTKSYMPTVSIAGLVIGAVAATAWLVNLYRDTVGEQVKLSDGMRTVQQDVSRLNTQFEVQGRQLQSIDGTLKTLMRQNAWAPEVRKN